MKSEKYQLLSLNFTIPLTIIVIGLTSVTTQILIIREMSTIFQGNELSLGTMLGVWLFWTGIGSLLLPKISFLKNHPLKKISIVQIVLTVLLPLYLLFIRSAKHILSLIPGEIIGYIPMFIMSLMVLAPFCLLSGFLYSISCQWVESILSKGPRSIARVYIWDAVGASIGGVLASLFLIRFLSPFQILIILASLNFIAAVYNGRFNPFKATSLRITWNLILPLLFLYLGLFYSSKIQSYCNQILWKGYNLIKTTNTAYGNVAVIKTGNQISLFHNGLHLFSLSDQLTAEESVHFSLLQHKNPEYVLLVSGNVQSSMAEVLKHPNVKSLYYVELDPAIVEYAIMYGDSGASEIRSDPRVTVKTIDARLFIKQTRKNFDLVILNLPHPYTAQLNRFYTVEFFREIKSILKKNGIISLTVQGGANVISPELSDYLNMVHATLKRVFSETVLLPGETIRIFSSQNKKFLTTDPDTLVKRLNNRNIHTEYIREYYLPYQLSEERRNYLNSKIKPVSTVSVNRDLHPLGYYFHTILWSTTYMGGFKKIFHFFSQVKMWQIISFLIIITMLIYIMKKNTPQSLSRWSVEFSIIGVGFSEISIEFILILAFQILHGYVYQMLAVLIAGYMVGLSLGGWSSLLSRIKDKNIPVLFQNIQFFMFILPVCIGIILYIFHNITIFSTNTAMLAFPFTFILLICGFLGGFQFALGNHLFFKFKRSVSKTAGFLYCMDLLGSAGGALLTSAFFIPILGIYKTLAILAFLNFSGFVLLKISLRKFSNELSF